MTCSRAKKTGITTDGGWAQYMVGPWESFAAVPDGLSNEQAAPLMCAGVTVFNSIRNAKVLAGSVVAVQGIGGLGHLAIQYAAKMGYYVVAISTGESKRQLAFELGAKVYIDTSKQDATAELFKLGGAKLIVSTAFSGKAQSEMVNGLGIGGKLLILGAGHDPITTSPLQLIGARRNIQGWPAGPALDSQEAMEFAHSQGIKTYVETYPLEKIQEAYERMLSNQARFRVVLQLQK